MTSTMPRRGYRIWMTLIVVVVVIGLAAWLYYIFGPTTVPDLVGTQYQTTGVSLAAANLTLGTASQVATDAVAEGTVTSQSPAAGAKTRKGTAVGVTYVVAPTRADVPDVEGTDVAAASQKLTEALFIPVTVDIFDVDDELGTVLKQIPSPTSSWITGQPVVLAVAAGPSDGHGTAVPDLRGMTLQQATAAAQKAGLGIDGLVADPNSTGGTVSEQAPWNGTVVKPGTTVLVLITK